MMICCSESVSYFLNISKLIKVTTSSLAVSALESTTREGPGIL